MSPRPEGSKNEDYEKKRNSLLAKLFEKLVQEEFREFPSLRNSAKLLTVSVPTLQHYFEDREGLMSALLVFIKEKGDPYLQRLSIPEGKGKTSIYKLLEFIKEGFERGHVGTFHQFGLIQGLGEDELGPGYLNQLFEPFLQAVEKRIGIQQERKELAPGDPRLAALFLISPLLLALLHQTKLGGDKVRPLALDQYLKDHADVFWKAYGLSEQKKR